jgi:hypothetical protein
MNAPLANKPAQVGSQQLTKPLTSELALAVKELDTDRPVGLNTSLLPEAICQEVIASIDFDRTVTPEQASEFAKRLTACWPTFNPHDAPRFVASLIAVFAAHPESICRRIIDPVKGMPAHHTFLPSIPDVNAAFLAEKRRRDLIRANALSHIQERHRREREREEEASYKPGTAEERAAAVARVLKANSMGAA